MKMDARYQGFTEHQRNEPLHFTPISMLDTPPPAPARPVYNDQDNWSNSREVIPVYFDRDLPAPTVLDSERRRQHARDLIDRDIDVRFASAREMASASLELYVSGLISWEGYARLAFQPELHPDYNSTIGALLGVRAEPDKPQDFVRLWEERLAYERRYSVANAKQVRATERLTLIMRRLAGIPTLRA